LAECGIQVLALSASSCQVVHVVSFSIEQNGVCTNNTNTNNATLGDSSRVHLCGR